VSQKVPCCKCGVPILESTALRTDGLCMPCKGGYRESIDEGKRHVGEQRERMLTDPYRKLWGTRPPFPERLRWPLTSPKTLFCCQSLGRGRLHRWISPILLQQHAEEGLIALGAFQTLELLQEAKDVLFPSIPVPISIAERRRALSSYPEDNSPTPEWSEKLDALDNRYWADSEGITLRLEAFARNHGLVSIAE